MEFKPNPICPICTGYCDTVIIAGLEWLRCRICGWMKGLDKW